MYTQGCQDRGSELLATSFVGSTWAESYGHWATSKAKRPLRFRTFLTPKVPSDPPVASEVSGELATQPNRLPSNHSMIALS